MSQSWCSHPNAIYDVQLQKRIALRMQPRCEATLTQPLQRVWILQHSVANLHRSTHVATPNDNNHAAIPMRSAAADSTHAWNYARRNSHSWQNTEEERIRDRKARSRTRRTHEVPFIAAACNHCTEKYTVSCSGFSHHKVSTSQSPTSLRHHFPSSLLPFLTTSLPRNFP